MILETREVSTPIGPVVLYAREERLCGLEFTDRRERCNALQQDLERRFGGFRARHAADPAGARARLEAYFDGELDTLESVPVDVEGTPFQQIVWAALRAIPAGQRRTYGELAAAMGRAHAARAVGAANARNPVSLVIPCHRVVEAGGSRVASRASSAGVLDHIEDQPGVRGLIARAGFEPEHHRLPEPRQGLGGRGGAPFAPGELAAARHHASAFAIHRHRAAHGESLPPAGSPGKRAGVACGSRAGVATPAAVRQRPELIARTE